MEKEPESIWRRPWKGRRAFLFWLLIVPILGALLGACLLAVITSITTPGMPVKDRIVAIVVLLAVCSFILWIFRGRNFKRFLFGCACLATLVALFYAEEDWRAKSEWESFKQQWEAKGENFDRDSVVPGQVPDEENFAMSPVWIAQVKYVLPKAADSWYGERIHSEDVSNYFTLLPISVSDVAGSKWAQHMPDPPETLGNWPVARMSDLRPFQSFYRNLEETNPSADIAITPKPQTPAQDVLLALSKYDSLIERLRQDSQMTYSRFPLDYNSDQAPARLVLPHLIGVKQLANVLQLRAIAELQNGQSDKALADVNLMVRLADANRDEPALISHLVRIAILQIALQPIYEGLANHKWSDSQLAELDSKLAKFDFLTDYKFAMRGEMIFFQEGDLDYLRRHPEQIQNMGSDTQTSPPFLARLVAKLIPSGWFYQNEMHSARAIEEFYLPDADTIREILSPSTIRTSDAAFNTDIRHANVYNILERSVLPTLSPVPIRFAYGQNAANLARVATALERYRLAHGEYPNSLDPLAPQFIARLPHDIINGQPLHYQRTANGHFILYSVGWNETDDGGAVVMKKGSPGVDRTQGDWVWRYPET